MNVYVQPAPGLTYSHDVDQLVMTRPTSDAVTYTTSYPPTIFLPRLRLFVTSDVKLSPFQKTNIKSVMTIID